NLAVYQVEVVPYFRGRIRRCVGTESSRALDNRQRRAEFMADHREELATEAVELFEVGDVLNYRDSSGNSAVRVVEGRCVRPGGRGAGRVRVVHLFCPDSLAVVESTVERPLLVRY